MSTGYITPYNRNQPGIGYGQQSMLNNQPNYMQQNFDAGSMFGAPGQTGSYMGNFTGTKNGQQVTGPMVDPNTGAMNFDDGGVTGLASAMPQGTEATNGWFGSGGDFSMGDTMNAVNGAMGVASTVMNGMNMMKGWDYQDSMLEIAQNQMKNANEQWGITKEELGRIKRVRTNLQAGYGNNGNYAAQSAKNPTEQKSAYIS